MGRPVSSKMHFLEVVLPLEAFMNWGLNLMGPFKRVTPKKKK